MTTPRLALAIAAVTIASAFLPAAAATQDLPERPWVKACGYKPWSGNECRSFCILGLWVGTEPGSHTEVCVVPNCACYIGAALAPRMEDRPIVLP